jgi:hypothetical protein
VQNFVMSRASNGDVDCLWLHKNFEILLSITLQTQYTNTVAVMA